MKPDVPDPGAAVPIPALKNPDRGYHIESVFILPDGRNPFHPELGFHASLFRKLIEACDAGRDSITLTQQYFYLTPYMEKDLDDALLRSMEKVFRQLAEDGIDLILRYAYNYEGVRILPGETEERIIGHIRQLAPFLRAHQGQIAALQSGFFGAWGEWHTSNLYGDQEAKNHIVSALLETFPAPGNVLVRYPVQKRALKLKDESQRSRLGFHNDYFTAGQHSHADGNDYVGEDYEYVKEEARKYAPYIMGEMPYAEQTEWGLHKIVSPEKVLKVLNEHRYSAFDLTQNADLNLRYWKTIRVSPAMLDNWRIRYDGRYFKNEDGREVSRSFYEFVRDHLGYRLNLSENAKITVTDGTLEYDLTLTNSGFARPMFPGEAYLVLIRDSEIVRKILLSDQIMNWHPSPEDNADAIAEYRYAGREHLDGLEGKFKVGLWIPKKDGTAGSRSDRNIKLAANDNVVHWWSADKKYAVNLIGEIRL